MTNIGSLEGWFVLTLFYRNIKLPIQHLPGVIGLLGPTWINHPWLLSSPTKQQKSGIAPRQSSGISITKRIAVLLASIIGQMLGS